MEDRQDHDVLVIEVPGRRSRHTVGELRAAVNNAAKVREDLLMHEILARLEARKAKLMRLGTPVNVNKAKMLDEISEEIKTLATSFPATPYL